MSERKARVIVMASGKGGVGKTAIAVNLATALALSGKRTMLADCDFGLGDAAIMLGVRADTTIEDVMTGRADLADTIVTTADSLMLVPGASGVAAEPEISAPVRRLLADGFAAHAGTLDYLIVDPPAGIQPTAMQLLALSDRILLVLTPEPTAFTNAYATIKLLALDHGATRVSVIANMVDSEASGRDLFARFHDVASRFLPSELEYLGPLPRDEHVRMAILRKQPCLSAFPESRASAAFGRLATALSTHPMPPSAGGTRFFGLEQSQWV